METIMRRLFLSLALALTLSAIGASSALAEAPKGAQKVPLYGPEADFGFSCESGVFPTPKTFGFVVFNTPGNETRLSGEVALKDAAPNTQFPLSVVQVTGTECTGSGAGTITTNKQGNGNLRFSVGREPGATKFFVEIGNFLEETFGNPAVELD
jgi:hypothetical protein